eukprot:1140634-Pelagomonas_calceolata.AAC.1
MGWLFTARPVLLAWLSGELDEAAQPLGLPGCPLLVRKGVHAVLPTLARVMLLQAPAAAESPSRSAGHA